MALFGKKPAQGGSASGGKEGVEEKSQGQTVEVKDERKPEFKLPKGGDELSYAAIVSPHITEKASDMRELNKYFFKVGANSSKIEIKKAIEKMYKVKVIKVNIISVPFKVRKVGRHEGIKPGFRKAIVTLAEGDKIEIIG